MGMLKSFMELFIHVYLIMSEALKRWGLPETLIRNDVEQGMASCGLMTHAISQFDSLIATIFLSVYIRTKVVSAPASPNTSAHGMSISRASTPDVEARPKSILRRSEKKSYFPKRVSFKLLSGRYELLKSKGLMRPVPIRGMVLTSRPEQTTIHHQGALAHRIVATAETLLSLGENKRSRKFIVPRIEWPIDNEAAR